MWCISDSDYNKHFKVIFPAVIRRTNDEFSCEEMIYIYIYFLDISV